MPVRGFLLVDVGHNRPRCVGITPELGPRTADDRRRISAESYRYRFGRVTQLHIVPSRSSPDLQ
jgi:hypothetical protein